jgi:hypothetical protein
MHSCRYTSCGRSKRYSEGGIGHLVFRKRLIFSRESFSKASLPILFNQNASTMCINFRASGVEGF